LTAAPTLQDRPDMGDKQQFLTIRNGLLVRAPAKINLSLLVAGKRPDGFHELETVMAKVDFFDEILLRPGSKDGIELLCTGPYPAPPGKDNLVHRAAQMLLDTCRLPHNINITLKKNIPPGSGLGSASSDAAATLLGLNRLLNTELPPHLLRKMAADLGSDVPFFLSGPLAFCTGRGEKIGKLDKNFDFVALLFLPNLSVSTKRVYENYKHDETLYRSLKTAINGYISTNRIDLVAKMCANMLQSTCFELAEGLKKLKTRIESLGCGPLCLSGSGSAMFRIFDPPDRQAAHRCKGLIDREFDCRNVIVSNNRW
jgi:4-diphosphocytidyl-2-C-methyl-D-erythritol kinase